MAEAGAGQRLDVFLAAKLAARPAGVGDAGGVSRTAISRQIGAAGVTVNGAAGTPSRKLRVRDVVV